MPQIAGILAAAAGLPWAAVTWLLAMLLLMSGGYSRVEQLSTYLVASVTILTVLCVLVLPYTPYAIDWNAVVRGLKVTVPAAGVAAAFSVFGITGVGATELYAYPYWCLEKGYARFAGPRDASQAWARARGWMRVMQLDAWCSMVVFSLATVAFYFMGAAVLNPQGPTPGKDMIFTLSQMYARPFGAWTQIVFLIGAAAVLFKTLYVSFAGHSRLTADFCSLARFVRFAMHTRGRWVQRFCLSTRCSPWCCSCCSRNRGKMVIFGGVGSSHYLTHHRCHHRLLSLSRHRPQLSAAARFRSLPLGSLVLDFLRGRLRRLQPNDETARSGQWMITVAR